MQNQHMLLLVIDRAHTVRKGTLTMIVECKSCKILYVVEIRSLPPCCHVMVGDILSILIGY